MEGQSTHQAQSYKSKTGSKVTPFGMLGANRNQKPHEVKSKPGRKVSGFVDSSGGDYQSGQSHRKPLFLQSKMQQH